MIDGRSGPSPAPNADGARPDGDGVSFSVFSENATSIELCLFASARSRSEARQVAMTENGEGRWQAYVPGLAPGALYGYRADGPYAPDQGHRFNKAKLLTDPYARAITRPGVWHPLLVVGDERSADHRDSAPVAPRSVVVDPSFAWERATPLRTPWSETVIYECHVEGMTALHPDVPPEFRGTYLGLAAEPVIDHLRQLGVTAVELLPVHHSVTERHLAERERVNYWGYNTLGYFAPDSRYATAGTGVQVAEFQTMVRALHRGGIEVILDVVFNHTGEAAADGPTLSLRGIDNHTYYRGAGPSGYADYSGCGNALEMGHPQTLKLVLDSLRYWVEEMHVDGFRFDLAPALGRERDGFDPGSSFFKALYQDPVLAGTKLIAEPWDLGHDGYRLGGFPRGWVEWNGRYRDGVRRFWRSDPGCIGDVAERLVGSSDQFGLSGRGPTASVNFVTCHDGFSLRDLVSYERKHNEANGENNRDGADHNDSRNWGAEGETDRESVMRTRRRVMRGFLATLAFSQGVPMLRQGDEIAQTHHGNNNTYCQNNELAWVDWSLVHEQRALLAFTRRLFGLRRAYPLLRAKQYFAGEPGADGMKDLTWLREDGNEMTAAEWHDHERRAVAMLMYGDASQTEGKPLLLIANASHRANTFTLPRLPGDGLWTELLDTAFPDARLKIRSRGVRVSPHGLVLLAYGEGA